MTQLQTTSTVEERSSHRAALVFVGLFASLAAALLALLLWGEFPAAIVLVLIVGAVAALASFASPSVERIALFGLSAVLIGSIAVLGVGIAQIAAALLADQTGPPEPADPALLFLADEKIEAAAADPAFRLELTEDELNAVLQDALAETDTPFRRVSIVITNDIGDPGRIDFEGVFKSGDLSVNGTLEAEVVSGTIDLEIVDVDVGLFTVPGVGRSAIEDMIESVADLEAAIAEEGADIQEITIGAHAIVITGVNPGGGDINAEKVLESFGDLDPESIEPEPRFGLGRVSDTRAAGSPVYLALGDSLAANVGVDDAAAGYVSRFHALLEERDSTSYGLVNLGISGETSGALLNGGQLDDAEGVADVAYVTIDIGANDLLGHLGSPTCSDDIQAPDCQGRIEATLASYERNIAEILDRLGEAFPNATIIFLTAYNPFSFGFGDAVAFEAESDATLGRLNTIATLAAVERGFLVADGFAPMQATVTFTTRMSDANPDIHPTELGYDVLAGALWDAISAAE